MLGTREFAEIRQAIDSFEAKRPLPSRQERGGSTCTSILTIYKFDPKAVLPYASNTAGRNKTR